MLSGEMYPGTSFFTDTHDMSSAIGNLHPSKQHKILSKIAKYTMSRLEAQEWFDGFMFDELESIVNHLIDEDCGYIMEASKMSEMFSNMDQRRNQLSVYSNILDLMVGEYSTETNIRFIIYDLTEESRGIKDDLYETMNIIKGFVSAVDMPSSANDS